MFKTPTTENSVLRRFLPGVSKFKPRIRKIVLFGSRARDDELPWSDYDVLVRVDRCDQALVASIYDIAVELQADIGCDLSLKIISEAEWERRRLLNSTFVANVLREGIVLG